jgi:hypothetical protein
MVILHLSMGELGHAHHRGLLNCDLAPASTQMAAQASELPAGREPMSQRWCYFYGRRGQPTRGSSRGRKRVAFVRY